MARNPEPSRSTIHPMHCRCRSCRAEDFHVFRQARQRQFDRLLWALWAVGSVLLAGGLAARLLPLLCR